MDTRPLTVKKHLVVHLDVLGYKEILKGKYKDDENSFLQIMDDIICNTYEKIDNANKDASLDIYKIKVRMFSDNFLLYLNIEEDNLNINKYILKTFKLISSIIKELILKHNIFVRGAMVIGNFHASNEYVFGSGLIDAYLLETDKAVYPRIIIDDSVLKYLDREYLSICLNTKNEQINSIKNELLIYTKMNNTSGGKHKYFIKKLKYLTDRLKSTISELMFCHYKVNDKNTAETYVFIRNFCDVADDIVLKGNYGNLKQLSKYLEDFDDFIEKYNLNIINSYIQERKERVNLDDEGNSYLNYLAFDISVLFYCIDRTETQFPTYSISPTKGFLITAGILNDKILMNATVDELMIEREENLEKLEKHKNIIFSNILSNNVERIKTKYIHLAKYHNDFCNSLYIENRITEKELCDLLIDHN